MKRELNHLLTSSWMRWCCSALVWLVVGAMVVQLAIPTRLAALDRFVDQEQSEEEDSEPAESPGEEYLPQFCGASLGRIRRPEAPHWQTFVSLYVRFGKQSIVRSLMPAELACRNGTGGPLHC